LHESIGRSLLTGWARTAPTAATVVPAGDEVHVRSALTTAPARGVIARGLGRSYGDAAQNAGGVVLDMTAGSRSIPLDAATGVVTAGGAVTIGGLIRFLVPRGFFVPVTPGTRHVTVGGAVAADIHGKNHHVDGSWMDHVVRLTLVTPDGEARTIDRAADAATFWATGGGLGLTGIVTSCSFRAVRVASSGMLVDTTRLDGLDAVLAAMSDPAGRRYSVAWIDAGATGARLGRGVLTEADHAPSDAFVGRCPLALAFPSAPGLPAEVTMPVMNRWTIAAANDARWQRSPRSRRDELETIAAFFHPLDAIDGWNRLYGRRGFVQWQCAVPVGAEDTLGTVLSTMTKARLPSFLTVLKRLGAANPGPLSFPLPGWTLAVDIPAATSDLAATLDQLDRLVVDGGGRVYLAKDARLAPELLPVMYPRLDEWRRARDRLDPGGVLQSDLGRRLGLVGRRSSVPR
jgi:decaprenylphospho-beta-D-ribofuranose 2-oxidase